MSDINIEDKTIEHYAGLIIIMKEKLNIDISSETADKIMYEWLTDKEVRKYLNDNISYDLDVMKLHGDISSTSKNMRISSRLSPALRFLKEYPDTQISFNQKNPKREGSISKERYENYKSSTTYNEFKERDGNGGDITYDFDRGYLVIHSEHAPKPKYIKNKVEDDDS
jgi:hypothetical protein